MFKPILSLLLQTYGSLNGWYEWSRLCRYEKCYFFQNLGKFAFFCFLNEMVSFWTRVPCRIVRARGNIFYGLFIYDLQLPEKFWISLKHDFYLIFFNAIFCLLQIALILAKKCHWLSLRHSDVGKSKLFTSNFIAFCSLIDRLQGCKVNIYSFFNAEDLLPVYLLHFIFVKMLTSFIP